MNKKDISLANKIVFIVVIIFISVNIILFTGGTILNKQAFYELEKEKAELIAKNYAPLISVNLFLGMTKKVKFLAKKILENDNVLKVSIYNNNNNKVFSNSKGNIKCTIKTKTPIFQPNSDIKIGTLEIFYSTSHFENFMKKYFIYLFLSFIFIIFSLVGLYLYIKKLLFPLKKLTTILKNYNPEIRMNIPYKDRKDEVGLISNAISISNKKTLEYSKNLQSLTQKLIEQNSTLEEKIQEEIQLLREKDKQLIHQSRLAQMGEMISMIAHQWRQPLSSINSTINNLSFQLLFNDDIDKKLFVDELNLIEKYSQHLSKTIDDFRNFFKENKNFSNVSMESLLEDTLNIAKVSLENKNITIKLDYKCDKTIKTYPNELKQVFLNMIKNAQDAILENEIKNPYIKISTICDDNYAYFIIEDNAGGIPEEILNKIFDPYFSTKLEKDGTGLGLYMSKTIIEDHCKGKLIAKNSDEGAVFTIKLPWNIDEKNRSNHDR